MKFKKPPIGGFFYIFALPIPYKMKTAALIFGGIVACGVIAQIVLFIRSVKKK